MIWPFTRRATTPVYPAPRVGDLADLDDRALVALAVQRNQDAFAVLYTRYCPVVYRYVAYRTLRQQVAEDLTAEVFLNAWDAIARYKDQGVPLRAWLLRLAHNEVIDHYRKRRPGIPLDAEADALPTGDGPEVALQLAAEHLELVKAVQQLHPEWQQVILLRFVEGLSFEEIGVVLGKQSNACRQLQHRALARLRALLADGVSYDD